MFSKVISSKVVKKSGLCGKELSADFNTSANFCHVVCHSFKFDQILSITVGEKDKDLY